MHVIVGEDEFLVERVRDVIIQRTEGNPTVETHHCAELTGPMVYGLVTPTLMQEARVIVFTHGELDLCQRYRWNNQFHLANLDFPEAPSEQMMVAQSTCR